MSIDFRKIISVASKVSRTGDGLQLSPWLKAGGQIPIHSSYDIVEEDPELLKIKPNHDNERFLKIVTLQVGEEEKKKELTVADLTRKKKKPVKLQDQFTITLTEIDIKNSEQKIPEMPSLYQVGKIKDENKEIKSEDVFYQGRVNIFNVESPGVYDEENDEFDGSYIKLSAFDKNSIQVLEQFILLPKGDFAARFAEDLGPGRIEIEIFAGSILKQDSSNIKYPPYFADFYLRRIFK